MYAATKISKLNKKLSLRKAEPRKLFPDGLGSKGTTQILFETLLLSKVMASALIKSGNCFSGENS